jgi:hypothetical protein
MNRRKIVFLGMLFVSLFTVCKLARGKELTNTTLPQERLKIEVSALETNSNYDLKPLYGLKVASNFRVKKPIFFVFSFYQFFQDDSNFYLIDSRIRYCGIKASSLYPAANLEVGYLNINVDPFLIPKFHQDISRQEQGDLIRRKL